MAGLNVEITDLPTATVTNVNDFLVIKQGATDRKISWSNLLTAHAGLTNNPHGVTKAQLGLSNVTNDVQLKASALLSDLPDKNTSRANLQVYSTSQVDSQHNAHANSTANPHNVTKAQIGLSNVTNNEQLIRNSNLNDLQSKSQARVNLDVYAKSEVTAQVNLHANLSNNPHNVTKTQVGLSSVTNDAQLKRASNLSDLTNAATARTNLNVYATSQVDSQHNGHANRTDNPHGVTKTQVGLSNVPNWTTTSSPTDGSPSKFATAAAVKAVYDQSTPFIMPSGGIILWSGQISGIPSGWTLCDGTLGTPDLRSKFVIGAGSTYDPNNTGGATSHTHSTTVLSHSLTVSEMPAHQHQEGGTNYTSSKYGASNAGPTGSRRQGSTTTNDTSALTSFEGGGQGHAHGATTSTTGHLPPFYALAYIMKL